MVRWEGCLHRPIIRHPFSLRFHDGYCIAWGHGMRRRDRDRKNMRVCVCVCQRGIGLGLAIAIGKGCVMSKNS